MDKDGKCGASVFTEYYVEFFVKTGESTVIYIRVYIIEKGILFTVNKDDKHKCYKIKTIFSFAIVIGQVNC